MIIRASGIGTGGIVLTVDKILPPVTITPFATCQLYHCCIGISALLVTYTAVVMVHCLAFVRAVRSGWVVADANQ